MTRLSFPKPRIDRKSFLLRGDFRWKPSLYVRSTFGGSNGNARRVRVSLVFSSFLSFSLSLSSSRDSAFADRISATVPPAEMTLPRKFYNGSSRSRSKKEVFFSTHNRQFYRMNLYRRNFDPITREFCLQSPRRLDRKLKIALVRFRHLAAGGVCSCSNGTNISRDSRIFHEYCAQPAIIHFLDSCIRSYGEMMSMLILLSELVQCSPRKLNAYPRYSSRIEKELRKRECILYRGAVPPLASNSDERFFRPRARAHTHEYFAKVIVELNKVELRERYYI